MATSDGIRSIRERRKDFEGWIEDACAIENGLTDWELEFVEDLSRKCEKDPLFLPTERQLEKLIQIVEEKG